MIRNRLTAFALAVLLAMGAAACDDTTGDSDGAAPAPDGVTTTDPIEPGGDGTLGTATPAPDPATGDIDGGATE